MTWRDHVNKKILIAVMFSHLLKFRFTTAARYAAPHGSNVLTYPYHGIIYFPINLSAEPQKIYYTHFYFIFFLVKQQNRLFANLKLTSDMHILILCIKRFNILYPTYFVARFVYFILCNADYHDVNKDFSW